MESHHKHIGVCHNCEVCKKCLGHPELYADPVFNFIIEGNRIDAHLVCIMPRLYEIEGIDESYFWKNKQHLNKHTSRYYPYFNGGQLYN